MRSTDICKTKHNTKQLLSVYTCPKQGCKNANWDNSTVIIKVKLKKINSKDEEMKYTNEKMTWNSHDTNLSWYVPKANVDHTISGQGTAISTLDNSITTPRASAT